MKRFGKIPMKLLVTYSLIAANLCDRMKILGELRLIPVMLASNRNIGNDWR